MAKKCSMLKTFLRLFITSSFPFEKQVINIDFLFCSQMGIKKTAA
jgi:hypothetical protein